MTTSVTVYTWGKGTEPSVVEGVYRLGDDGVVRLSVVMEEARPMLESFMTRGVGSYFEPGRRAWPHDGEHFLKALVRLNSNSSYHAYEPDDPEAYQGGGGGRTPKARNRNADAGSVNSQRRLEVHRR